MERFILVSFFLSAVAESLEDLLFSFVAKKRPLASPQAPQSWSLRSPSSRCASSLLTLVSSSLSALPLCLQRSSGSELQEIMRRRQEKLAASTCDSGVESFDEGSTHWAPVRFGFVKTPACYFLVALSSSGGDRPCGFRGENAAQAGTFEPTPVGKTNPTNLWSVQNVRKYTERRIFHHVCLMFTYGGDSLCSA